MGNIPGCCMTKEHKLTIISSEINVPEGTPLNEEKCRNEKDEVASNLNIPEAIPPAKTRQQ